MGLLGVLKWVGQSLYEKVNEQGYRAMERASGEYRAQHGSELKLGGKTLREWDGSWTTLGVLSNANLGHLSSSVGLYRARLAGEIVYIGRAVEYSNGGLRKRLSDYTRASDSSRTHNSGKLMNAHSSALTIDILITGGDQDAADVARKLEAYFIGKYKPQWNKRLK